MSPAELDIEALTVLDSMHQHIALIDPNGNVLAVNRAWQAFGKRNGAPGGSEDSVGVNYLQVCTSADPHAQRARAGIEAVLGGRQALFEMEYPYHGNGEERC